MSKKKNDDESENYSEDRHSNIESELSEKRITRSALIHNPASFGKNIGMLTRQKCTRESSKGVKTLVNLELDESIVEIEPSSSHSSSQKPNVDNSKKQISSSAINHNNLRANLNISSSSLSANAPSSFSIVRAPIFTRQVPQSKEDKIINQSNFQKFLQEKLAKEGLRIEMNSELVRFMNNGLEMYLKNVIERLIAICRTRNVNMNLFSKQMERNPVFKIHTYNWESQIGGNNQQQISFGPYKDLSIVFTRSMRNSISMLEEYHELLQRKMKYERYSVYKNKMEEITAQKEKEREKEKEKEKNTHGSNVNQPSDKPVVGRRARKRETSILKSYRNTLAKSQKKDEIDRQKTNTLNTLETVLDTRQKNTSLGGTLSGARLDAEMSSLKGESHNFETYTKLSEVSKSENPIGFNSDSNEVSFNIFKNYIPSQNSKIFTSASKRRITLKDLIFYLENERRTPLQNLILHKAIIKLNQLSSH